MSTKQKKRFILFFTVCLVFSIAPAAGAMHIMEGYLPASLCVGWGIVSLPFLALGIINIRKRIAKQHESLMLLALCGAFVFVISSLKIPSVTGSCSHMTGTGLGAILFGPTITSVLGVIVLIFQAILLAHGGVTTLGANAFSMAIAGPLLSFAVYHLLKKVNVNRKHSVFFAAFLGDIFTYCVTSVQLAVAYPAENGGVFGSMLKFLSVFAPTQLPLAIVEGILTVVIVIGLETYASKELKGLGFLGGNEA